MIAEDDVCARIASDDVCSVTSENPVKTDPAEDRIVSAGIWLGGLNALDEIRGQDSLRPGKERCWCRPLAPSARGSPGQH